MACDLHGLVRKPRANHSGGVTTYDCSGGNVLNHEGAGLDHGATTDPDPWSDEALCRDPGLGLNDDGTDEDWKVRGSVIV